MKTLLLMMVSLWCGALMAAPPLAKSAPVPVMLTCTGKDDVGEQFCEAIATRMFVAGGKFQRITEPSFPALVTVCTFGKTSDVQQVYGACSNQVHPAANRKSFDAPSRTLTYLPTSTGLAAMTEVDVVSRLAEEHLRK